MTRRLHRTLLCTLGAVALGVGVAGLAWACTPQAYIYLSPTSVAEEGSRVTVTGKGFVSGPVQVRLDSGPTLATATGPDFTVEVKIPKAAAGVYYMHAVAYQPDGSLAADATRALLVKATPAPKRSEPVPSSEPTPAPARERLRATPERSPAPERKATPAASEPAATEAPAEDAAAAPATASSRAQSPARGKSPAKAKGASTPAPPAAPQPVAIAPLASSLSNPWSGQPPAGPGLDAAPASAKPSGGIPWLGVGMLVLGLAVLGGAGFALVRARPRPPAREASAGALPIAGPPSLEEAEAGCPSLEEELDGLIAESAARAQSDSAASEQPAPCEPAGAPR